MASKLLLILKTILDLIAFGLAVAAERRRSTAIIGTDINADYKYCVYDSDISTNFGVGAFSFLMVSQVIIMIASRCLCCGKSLNSGGARVWAVVFYLLCWVTFIIAEACLLAGSVRNAYHTKRTFADDSLSCEMLRKGTFAAGAAFIIITSILADFYYLAYTKARGSINPYGKDTGVRMGTYSST